MSQDLAMVLEEQKEFLRPETYQRLKDNLGKLPDEVRLSIINQLMNASHLKHLISEYENQHTEVLKDAERRFDALEKGYVKQYNEAMSQAETQDRESALKNAEDSIANLNQ